MGAVYRAWLRAHPFSDPYDLALALALSRDVGHGRRLLISGYLLTAGAPLSANEATIRVTTSRHSCVSRNSRMCLKRNGLELILL